MQIKARYLGQIACYTTIVLTAWENLSEEPVLISFNTIYIGGKKKIKSLHPPLKWKNNPWVTYFSSAINQCKAGSEELTEEAMAYLKHLAVPYKAKACTRLPARRDAWDVQWGKDHEASLTLKINTSLMKKLSVAWECGWVPAPCGHQHSPSPRDQGTVLLAWQVTPGEWHHPRASMHMKTISEASVSMAALRHVQEFTPKQTAAYSQGKKKIIPQLTIRAKCLVFNTNTHLCTEPAGKHVLEQYLASRWRPGERQIFVRWTGLGLAPRSQTQRLGPTSLPLVQFTE